MRWLVFSLVIGLLACPAIALETDQFTVPARPLLDLGSQLDDQVATQLRQVIAGANSTYDHEMADVAATGSPFWQHVHRRRADRAINQIGVAEAAYEVIAGPGLPNCRIEDWIQDHAHAAALQPMSIGDSIYGANPFEKPLLLVDLSPTVRLHDQYVGTDKLGHFFQQGKQYFDAYLDARLHGKSEGHAIRAAVKVGVGQENGFFGLAMDGVYSNGDLAANYAGFLFYRNLFEPVRLGDRTLDPIVIHDGPHLKLSPRADRDLLSPFITEHWNEAMNPSYLGGGWRKYARQHVAQRVDSWMAFYHSTPAAEGERILRLQTFFGQDYGHSGMIDVITLANTPATEVVASR